MSQERTQQRQQQARGVTFSVRLIAGERLAELTKTLRSVVGPMRGTPGCRRCDLLADVQRPDELQLFVVWGSEEDFERHVRGALFRRVLQTMELSPEPPELEIRTTVGVRGVDLLREILDERPGEHHPLDLRKSDVEQTQ